MAAVEQLITDNLNIWSSAVKAKSAVGRGARKKLELYGIKKLRELILELAVRGLLVPQDPSDEPAAELLKTIATEKAKLLEDGKLKKQKILPPISKDEMPFTLPEGWEWTRLNEIGHEWGQKTPDKAFTYIDVGAINKELGFVSEPSTLTANEAPSRARKIVKKGTVIYSTVRPYLLNIAVINEEFDPEPIASTAFAIIHPFDGVLASFIYRYLRSPTFINYVESCQTGIAYPAVNDKQFFSGLFPVAPLGEQRRIIAKVDELMALCDELEQKQSDSISANKILVENLLNALTKLADQVEFEETWKRIAEHFDILFTTDESIDRLKQTILQLAVMGRLVPQGSNDESASILLNKAQVSKKELGSIRKIRNDKESYEPADLFKVPDKWQWTCVGQFSHVLGGKRVPRGYSLLNTPTDHVYIRVTDMKEQTVSQDELKYIDNDIYEQISKYIINKEDIYVTIAGTIGAVGTIPENLDGMNLTENASKLIFRNINQEFLVITLSSSYIQKQFEEAVNQMAQPKLSLTSIKHTSIAIPPIEEQKRIVAKVNELMALCDSLKERLNDASAIQTCLADAIIEQAVA
jgi:type I restriction enzyme, S subunit